MWLPDRKVPCWGGEVGVSNLSYLRAEYGSEITLNEVLIIVTWNRKEGYLHQVSPKVDDADLIPDYFI